MSEVFFIACRNKGSVHIEERMTAKVMSCMRAVCCCNGELSDDERPFVDSQNEPDIIAARTAPTGFVFLFRRLCFILSCNFFNGNYILTDFYWDNL